MNLTVRKRGNVITQCELYYDRQSLDNEVDAAAEVDQDRDIKFCETFELPGHESLIYGRLNKSSNS